MVDFNLNETADEEFNLHRARVREASARRVPFPRRYSREPTLCSPDEGGLLPDSSGVENDDTVVAAGDGTCVNDRILHYHQQQHSTESQLHDFLQFRGTGATTGSGPEDMVAQEMAEGYTQLLHSVAVQEPQEFISLQELQPRIHPQDICAQIVSSTSHQLYHQQQQQRNGDQQQRNYYNLSSVQE